MKHFLSVFTTMTLLFFSACSGNKNGSACDGELIDAYNEMNVARNAANSVYATNLDLVDSLKAQETFLKLYPDAHCRAFIVNSNNTEITIKSSEIRKNVNQIKASLARMLNQ